MSKSNEAILVLGDGNIYEGASVGAEGCKCGELIFNTSQTGYQEILTDPSYTEQIVVFTQPHIGNVGVNQLDMESKQAWVSGTVIKNFSNNASNWRAESSLSHFLKQQDIIAITDIDTRALTHHLRSHGSQSAAIMAGNIDVERALFLAKNYSGLLGKDLIPRVTTAQTYFWDEGNLVFNKNEAKQNKYRVVVYDFGVKQSILRLLVDSGCEVIVVPANIPYRDLITLNPTGVVLSNGPGDPAACHYAIQNVKTLLELSIPIMAICLGHQILALACGAATQKMEFGHHGANHPIKCLKTNRVFISSQNHGFVVCEENLPSCLKVTHRSLFDGTIAGIEYKNGMAFGFQGHPEAGPGPLELTELFGKFINLLGTYHAKKL